MVRSRFHIDIVGDGRRFDVFDRARELRHSYVRRSTASLQLLSFEVLILLRQPYRNVKFYGTHYPIKFIILSMLGSFVKSFSCMHLHARAQ